MKKRIVVAALFAAVIGFCGNIRAKAELSDKPVIIKIVPPEEHIDLKMSLGSLGTFGVTARNYFKNSNRFNTPMYFTRSYVSLDPREARGFSRDIKPFRFGWLYGIDAAKDAYRKRDMPKTFANTQRFKLYSSFPEFLVRPSRMVDKAKPVLLFTVGSKTILYPVNEVSPINKYVLYLKKAEDQSTASEGSPVVLDVEKIRPVKKY